ncbi:MAG: type II toxin-antitoxin system HipA family toxin [Rhodoferax sp.]|jgi:serine/threonine-protein kinase HipA|nr:type II toxin-antitoxin system HipA family toxin [Rhodoferax sp.]MBP9061053.1 type II toxin-antitoxin system HipA family toxin [Rhodoferax sp.]MBP9686121.1 type II toxin-antitoxin system HipA family toxin [Rhodoferax sp.]
MGRKSHARSLSVWANGQRVGTWTIPTRGDTEFRYDPAWMSSPAGRPLSLSLPYTAGQPLKGERVRHFFDNLLPDSDAIRHRLATRFQTASTDAFDLLQAVGRDCVGAVQLLGRDESPTDIHRITGTPMRQDEIEKHLIQTTRSGPLSQWDDQEELRISLAGAQEKTALLWHEGAWMRPHGTTPTTHILKLPLGLVGHRQADFSSSVENEWLCMNLLGEFGLPVAKTEILQFGSQKVLSVERFDRQLHASGSWLMRLPQEDFCQVKGVASHLKYESDGGPGLADLAGVLSGSVQAGTDLATLLKTQLLFWMLAAPDGHAKNFSLRVLAQGRYCLTPLYDVMSIWPVEGNGANQFSRFKVKLAMAVLGKNKHYHFKDIQRRHFNHTAAKYFQRSDAEDLIEQVLERTPVAIDNMARKLPAGFPQWIAQSIFEGLRQSAEQLARMPKT